MSEVDLSIPRGNITFGPETMDKKLATIRAQSAILRPRVGQVQTTVGFVPRPDSVDALARAFRLGDVRLSQDDLAHAVEHGIEALDSGGGG